VVPGNFLAVFGVFDETDDRGIRGGPERSRIGVDLVGGAMRLANGSALGVDLLGGAIKDDKGSFGVAAGVAALSDFLTPGVIGGGARGFATSAGSSPGKIHRLAFSS